MKRAREKSEGAKERGKAEQGGRREVKWETVEQEMKKK